MIKSRKFSKLSLAVIVLSLLLVFSLVMGLTGAWFTDVKTNNGGVSMNFGHITLNVNNTTNFGFLNGDSSALTEPLMPGDKVKATLSVSNAGEAAYVVVYVGLKFSKTGEADRFALNKWYYYGDKNIGTEAETHDYDLIEVTFDGEENPTNLSKMTAIAKDDSASYSELQEYQAPSFYLNADLTLNGADYDDTYEDWTATVVYAVSAIQEKNLSQTQANIFAALKAMAMSSIQPAQQQSGGGGES